MDCENGYNPLYLRMLDQHFKREKVLRLLFGWPQTREQRRKVKIQNRIKGPVRICWDGKS